MGVSDMAGDDQRIGGVERELHTLLFRMEQMERHRLPDRLTEAEAAMANMESRIAELKMMSERTNSLVGTMRAEMTADIDQLSDSLTEKTSAIERKLDRLLLKISTVVATTIAITGGAVWVLNNLGTVLQLLGGK